MKIKQQALQQIIHSLIPEAFHSTPRITIPTSRTPNLMKYFSPSGRRHSICTSDTMLQCSTPFPVADPAPTSNPQPTQPKTYDTYPDNQNMTSPTSQTSNPSDNTEHLVCRIDKLSNQLILEQDNTTSVMDLLDAKREQQDIHDLCEQLDALKALLEDEKNKQISEMEQSHLLQEQHLKTKQQYKLQYKQAEAYFNAAEKCHCEEQEAFRNQLQQQCTAFQHQQQSTTSTTSIPPAQDQQALYLQTLLNQQQQFMQQQVQQTNAFMSQFSTGIKSLQKATEKQTQASGHQLQEQIKTADRKGPQMNRFPNFGNKDNESFVNWHNDLLKTFNKF